MGPADIRVRGMSKESTGVSHLGEDVFDEIINELVGMRQSWIHSLFTLHLVAISIVRFICSLGSHLALHHFFVESRHGWGCGGVDGECSRVEDVLKGEEEERTSWICWAYNVGASIVVEGEYQPKLFCYCRGAIVFVQGLVIVANCLAPLTMLLDLIEACAKQVVPPFSHPSICNDGLQGTFVEARVKVEELSAL